MSVLIASDRTAAPATTPWLARIGHAMARHQRAIVAVQWLVVIAYALLVSVPAFLPLPGMDDHIRNNLTRAAQFLFWGIWWPFVMLSMMTMGRVWCGVFCPEGAVSEWVSRRGLQRPIPRWIRWRGWPPVAFIGTTLYGQLTSVYQYPKAALLVLGGSTLAALAVGWLYGRGVRVWCRFLCPANGVFTLLAKLAPLHFAVNEQQWQAAERPATAVACPPLLDVHHKAGTGNCHACGRCSGHRDAVSLQWRSPSAELVKQKIGSSERIEVLTLLFGVLGVALAAFQWSSSPWFVQLKQMAALLAIQHNQLWLLEDNAPWWLLTHYPQVNDVFTWLDGLLILLYIGGMAALLGGWQWIVLRLAAHHIIRDSRAVWRLAYGLTPLGGISVFIGLSMLTVSQLALDRISVPGLAGLRAALLVVAVLWSLQLSHRLSATWQLSAARQICLLGAMLLAMLPILALWYLQCFVW